jgi:hypothetical protein
VTWDSWGSQSEPGAAWMVLVFVLVAVLVATLVLARLHRRQ